MAQDHRPGAIYDKKLISKLFIFLTLSFFIAYTLLTCLMAFASRHFGDNEWLYIILNDLYTPFVIVLFCLFSRKIESRRPIAYEIMTPKVFFAFLCASVPLMISGSVIGNAFSSFAGSVIGRDIENAIDTFIQTNPQAIVFVSAIIIAPVFEELMFRKVLIDKTSRFGVVFSVLISGFTFGSFHGNFYQFFYGCFLGFALAFMYCMYGKIIYCILLHASINLMGSVLPLLMEQLALSPFFIANFIAMCYSLLYFLCLPLGFIIIFRAFFHARQKYPHMLSLPGTGLFTEATGFWIYVAYSCVMFVVGMLL